MMLNAPGSPHGCDMYLPPVCPHVHTVALLCLLPGVLKDFLRELPEPLFTNALYSMLLDALSVRLPGDPDGSAKLMLSVLECLPKANQVSDHCHHHRLPHATFPCRTAR